MSKISSRVGFGEGVNIRNSSMVLLMTFPNVVTGQIVLMFMVPSSQLIWSCVLSTMVVPGLFLLFQGQ